MKTIYRGFELETKRERCLGGWDMVYYSIFRVSDGWEMDSGFSDDTDTLRTHMQTLKLLVDDYYDHPENWSDEARRAYLNALQPAKACAKE